MSDFTRRSLKKQTWSKWFCVLVLCVGVGSLCVYLGLTPEKIYAGYKVVISMTSKLQVEEFIRKLTEFVQGETGRRLWEVGCCVILCFGTLLLPRKRRGGAVILMAFSGFLVTIQSYGAEHSMFFGGAIVFSSFVCFVTMIFCHTDKEEELKEVNHE